MNKLKVKSIVKRIDKALLELSTATGGNHISAFICDGGICIDDFTNGKESFSYYRRVNDEQGDFKW